MADKNSFYCCKCCLLCLKRDTLLKYLKGYKRKASTEKQQTPATKRLKSPIVQIVRSLEIRIVMSPSPSLEETIKLDNVSILIRKTWAFSLLILFCM